MPMKRYKPEQIVTMLRQIEVSIANGKNTPQACKEAEITIQTFQDCHTEPRIVPTFRPSSGAHHRHAVHVLV